MLIRLLLLLAWVAPYALADVEFTTPSGGATVAGGSTLKVQWKDSGTKPPISSLQTYQLFLCAGGNDDSSFIQLAPVVTQGQFSAGNSASGTIQVNLGGTDKNAYFLKMISATTGGTVVNYSSRFTLSGMTGTFPENVEAGIKKVTGTSGPATQNNVDDSPGGGAGGAAGFSVPFSLQTGATRYAPMQRKPGTKITGNKASAQYPTSSVQLAKTMLPTPVAVTTMTMSGTFAVVSSIENTASPAPMPMNAMQKYLNRWRD